MARSLMRRIHPKAAGIDMGSETMYIAVEGSVKSFGTFTSSYQEAIAFLQSHGVTTVAMEATGVYWVAFYDMLDEGGLEVYVVNGAHARNLPGRKSDVSDCEWLREMHAHGLLRKSFIPPDSIRQLRAYVRLRDDHITMAAQHVQHMQKALVLMNIKLDRVISQVHGVSGMRMIKAILAGERSPDRLLALCERTIREKKKSEVIAALQGNYRPEHLFALRQAVECWEFYQHQILGCDKAIEELLQVMTHDGPPPGPTAPVKPIRHHRPAVEDLHSKLMMLTRGINPSAITGFTDLTLMHLIAETGTDLTRWRNDKHFTAWLGLSPLMHQSGRRKKKVFIKINTRAGQIFRVAAQPLAKSHRSAFGAFYRRIRARRGPKVAMKALARKLAVMYYNVMTKGITYVEQGVRLYEQRYREQQLQFLKKQARQLGLTLVPVS